MAAALLLSVAVLALVVGGIWLAGELGAVAAILLAFVLFRRFPANLEDFTNALVLLAFIGVLIGVFSPWGSFASP